MVAPNIQYSTRRNLLKRLKNLEKSIFIFIECLKFARLRSLEFTYLTLNGPRPFGWTSATQSVILKFRFVKKINRRLCCVFSRQQSRAAVTKSSANGQSQYAPGVTDTCHHHDDEYHLKYGEQVSLSAGMRPHAEYRSNLQRRPMDVQHCDHVTSPPCAAANGCAALTEVNRNSYG